MKGIFFLFFAGVIAAIAEPIGKDSAIEAIDTFVAHLEAHYGKSLDSSVIYLRPQQDEEHGYAIGDWKRVPAGKSVEHFAFLGRIVGDSSSGHIVLYEETTPTGDWAAFTCYYYWPSGDLAFVESSLRTFVASEDTRVERKIYFDRRGQQIRLNESHFNLHSDKRIQKKDDFGYWKVTIWKKLADVPFISLAKQIRNQ
jgi:hypothetical protein